MTNNFGYMMKYTYQDNGNDSSASLVTGVTAINNAVDYCAPSANTCTNLTYSWPAISILSQLEFTDPLGRTTDYPQPQTSAGALYQLPSGLQSVLQYDASGRVTAVTTPTGTWGYAYSGTKTNQTTTVTDPLGHTRVVVSNPTLDVITSDTNGDGNTTSYQYDSYNRVIKVTKPEGGYQTITYDGRGNVLSTVTVAKGGSSSITTSATYDTACSNPVKCNQPNSTTDGNGNTTTYGYNASTGLLTSVVYPSASGGHPHEVDTNYTQSYAWYVQSAGASATQAASPVWLVTNVVEGCSNAQTCAGTSSALEDWLAYGTTGSANNLQLTTLTRGAGDQSLTASTSMTYDQVGDIVTMSNPRGNATFFVYDADRERVGIVGPDPDGSGPLLNRAVRYTYGADGILTETDIGTVTAQSSAAWANFSTSASSLIGYDGNDRPITQTLVTGGTTQALTQYAYDAANRLQCTAVRMNASTFSSEPSSACTQGTAGSYGPDLITEYTYDNANQPLTRVSGYGTSAQRTDVTNTYGADGELTSEADGKGNLTTLVYTGYDQLYQVEFPNPSNGAVSSTTDYEQYTYDNNGNIVQDRRRDGVVVGYSYDAVNNPLSGPNGASYGYDVLNRLVLASLNGQSLSFVYDGLGRQTQQTSPLGTVVRQFDADGDRTSLTFPDGFAFSYSYDAADELTSITDSAGATIETIAYDNFGRRGTVTRPSVATTSYGYDSALRLNSLAHTFTDTTKNETFTLAYSPASQLTSQTSSNSLYDWSLPDAGSLAYTTNGQNKYATVGGNTFSYDARGDLSGDGVNTYSYDEANELTSLNSSTTLTYDALGRLYQTQGSATTQFLYEGSQLIGEYSGGALLRRYAPGDQTSEVAAWYEGSGTTNRRWLIPDAHGSAIAIANAAGTTVGINTYDAYGVAGPSNIGRFQFVGEPWLPETGLYQLGARAYSPTLGRFMQPDPEGYVDGLNFYNYVHSDPVNGLDPTGLDDCGSLTLDTNGTPVVTICPPSTGGFIVNFGGGLGSGLIGGLGALVKGWVLALQNNGRNLFSCTASFADDHSVASALHAVPGLNSGAGGFVADAVGGNAITGVAALGQSLVTGQGGGHSAAYNGAQALVAGPTLGFGPVVARVSPSLAAASPGLTDLAEIALVGAEYATGIAEAKLAYDAGSVFVGGVACATGLSK